MGEMSTVRDGMLIVDWLGRGGIAHTTQAWVREREGEGLATTVVTRRGRELAQSMVNVIAAGARGGAVLAHVAVVRAASRAVQDQAPCTVVLQGSVLPQMEMGVVKAARAAGNAVVFIAHEPFVTPALPGSLHELARLARSADVVICHSHFVAAEIGKLTGRADIGVIPLPLPLGLLDLVGTETSVLPLSDDPVALHFGNLHRAYKGTATIMKLAETGVPGWQVAIVGKGAPSRAESAQSVSRFLSPAELVATVAGADAAVLPYSRASQSAAVVLAQSLGLSVIASAVGGIPEQIEDGVTGRLIPPFAPTEAWREALGGLTDKDERTRIGVAAASGVRKAHEQFAAGIGSLLP